ncbi:MAG TPA: acyl carrier protein [Actinophytocola sp.]|nr:acyl carrier protein [Actinophytocola sp.]
MHATVAEQAGQIKTVVCRVLEVDEDQVGPTDHFIEVLGADSMKLIELLANLEIEFDVEVDPAEFERLITLDGVYDVLSVALGKSPDN